MGTMNFGIHLGGIRKWPLWRGDHCRELLEIFSEETLRQKDIIQADLLGNKTLLRRVQKVMVCDLWLEDIDPSCVFLCFKVCCLWSELWLEAAKVDALVQAAFTLQGSGVFEKRSNELFL